MNSTSSTLSRGYLIGLSATVLLSFTSILISYLNRTYALPSLVLAFWRDLFVSLGVWTALLLAAPSLFRLERTHWPFMLLYGLVLASFNAVWTFSVQLNGAAVATVLAYSSPAVTAALSRWLFKERISGAKVTSIILSLIGVLLVSGAHSPSAWKINPAGILLGLLTGLFYAAYGLFGKKASEELINTWTTLLYSFSCATLFLLLFNLIAAPFEGKGLMANLFWLGSSFSGWTILFFLGIGPTLGGFGLYVRSLGYLPATVVNLIAALEPALTVIWAYLLLQEQMTAVQWAGSLLLFTGIILLRLGEGRRPAAAVA